MNNKTHRYTLKMLVKPELKDGSLYLGKVELGGIGTADSDVQIIDVVFSEVIKNSLKEWLLNDKQNT